MAAFRAAVLSLATFAVVPGSTGDAGAPMARYTRSISDIKTEFTNDDKKVHILEQELQMKTEENKQTLLKFQDLDEKLSVALHQVGDLSKQQQLLNRMVEGFSRENEELKTQLAEKDAQVQRMGQMLNEYQEQLRVYSDPELNINKSLEDYYRDKDWRSLRKNLELLLSRSSEAYQQLQAISYGHGYPLWKVGSYCDEALAEVLISGAQGPNISESDGDTILHGAAEGNCIQLATKLLDQGADIETVDNGGATAIIIASRYGHLKMVEMLKERGANINRTDYKGMTSLHLAAEGGHLPVVKYLVEAGVDTTALDKDGLTALRRAENRRRSEVLVYLSSRVQETPSTTSTTEGSHNIDSRRTFIHRRMGDLVPIRFLRMSA